MFTIQVFKRRSVWWTAVGFFLLAMELGMWVPALGNMFAAQGISWLLPYVFAIGPLATILTPLLFGSMADWRYAAQNILGVLSVLGAVFLGLSFWSLQMGWGVGAFLAFYCVASLLGAPSWSLLATVTLANLKNKEKGFPVIRVWGTIGWILGGALVSWLSWDSSALSGVAASSVRLLLGLSCFMMPETKPMAGVSGVSTHWKSRLGLDAMVLFKERSFRVFLLSSLFFAIPLSAFYMYTPMHLSDLGIEHPSFSMTLGQVVEIFALLALSGILVKFRLRWVLVAALVLGLLRYLLFAFGGWTGGQLPLLLGIALQGPIYTFFYITGQMLVDRRVEPEMRGQAQALLGVMIGGVGGLVGSLLCGWYYAAVIPFTQGWLMFWSGLALCIACTLLYFWRGYVRHQEL